MTHFGDFEPLCHQVPSYPWCNLFYRQQLEHHNSSVLTGVSADPASAPVGVNPVCGIPLVGHDSSLANIANIIACALSIIIVALLIVWTSRRRAAVGRAEFRQFLVLYFLTLPFQLISTGAFLQQGSTALTVITAIHAGLVAATFWALLGNAIIATQVVEDGTPSAIIPFDFFALAFFVATTYIALDVAFTFTHTFGPSDPPQNLHSIPLFVFTSIWPGASVLSLPRLPVSVLTLLAPPRSSAALLYLLVMAYVVLGILNEIRPMWYFLLAAILFVLSQLDYFLLNKVICNHASHKIDGSFVATVLETAAVTVLYFAWRSITEDSWEDDMYYPR
ncbi:hypothetical protein BN946_scf184305.g12 [Trametes cinnabarina]|uniref:Uncharacterized protein n=1 Tax=Pycnoporus cinnabarinus TaxID=5643 RepID=A0A060SQM2_PYCCI|nr:hypothetical protein BN946_scf184305.g12 [Trametes cinnabarina]